MKKPILMEYVGDNKLTINKGGGGTSNCVKYAQSKGKEIIFINPNDYARKD